LSWQVSASVTIKTVEKYVDWENDNNEFDLLDKQVGAESSKLSLDQDHEKLSTILK
jgi:hypothetical protein